MRTVRLKSIEMCSAPGMLKWAMHYWGFVSDRPKLRKVMQSWPVGLTDSEWNKVLSGEVPHTIEGDTVVITI